MSQPAEGEEPPESTEAYIYTEKFLDVNEKPKMQSKKKQKDFLWQLLWDDSLMKGLRPELEIVV